MSEIKQEFDQVMAQLTTVGAPYELAGSERNGRHYTKAPADLAEVYSAVRRHGDREFLVYEGERRSFKQLLDEADEIAAALQAHGIEPGERVALAMRNYPEWMSVFIAVTSIGAVIVPVNSWGTPDDIVYTVEDAGARLVFCDQQRFDGAAEPLRERGVRPVVVRPVNAEDPHGLALFLADFRGASPVPAAINPEDLAMIMYTSGTSGRPKGAASTHRAICQALYNMECVAVAAAMCDSDKVGFMLERGFEPTSLLAVPLFHVSGCHAQFLANLRGGRRIVMMYKWDVGKAIDYIEQERITTIAAAPSMILDLLDSPAFDRAETGSLFNIGIGGAATPPKVARLLNEKLPHSFSGTGWGMTETNAQGASLTGRAFGLKPGSAGFPHPIVDIQVCDEAGNSLPAGATGELWVRSCANIREYWHRPEANEAEFRDGWLKTGDIGYLDEEGFLFLADRAKDLIIRGGENIYPVEIENLLLELDDIREVAAIGIPHERFGEEVAVVVHLQPQASPDPERLLAYAGSKLAPYKLPSRIFFSEEPLPRNASNKVLKPVLKARYAGPAGDTG